MSIQRLGVRDADAAAATLGEAFFDDPLLQIVAPDEAMRRRWGPGSAPGLMPHLF